MRFTCWGVHRMVKHAAGSFDIVDGKHFYQFDYTLGD
jgi:hypothetical protein